MYKQLVKEAVKTLTDLQIMYEICSEVNHQIAVKIFHTAWSFMNSTVKENFNKNYLFTQFMSAVHLSQAYFSSWLQKCLYNIIYKSKL